MEKNDFFRYIRIYKTMRIFFCLIAVLLFFLSGCSEEKTTAQFEVSAQSVSSGDTITFTNRSSNANYCLWDFGDGCVTFQTNPTHSYSSAGTYVVKLLAVGDDNSDMDSLSITVIKIAAADITVFDGKGIKEFRLGNTWADVQAAFPYSDTTSYIEYYNEYHTYRHEVYFYDKGVGVIFATPDSTISHNDIVYSIWTFSPYKALTAKGIKLGDTIEEVKKRYGKPQTYSGTEYTDYVYDSKGILFYSANSGKVDAIQVYDTSSEKIIEVKRVKIPKFLYKKL
jgi:PKD repeat protein